MCKERKCTSVKCEHIKYLICFRYPFTFSNVPTYIYIHMVHTHGKFREILNQRDIYVCVLCVSYSI